MANGPKSGKPNQAKRTLRQDALVDRLRHDPSQPPAVEWQGFLGKSEKEGYWRLYLTRALIEYIEIAESDIVDQKPRSEGDPEAGSRIWIKETATLTRGPASRLPARVAVRGSPSQPRGVRPGIALAGRLMMIPLLPWVTAAHCWSAVLDALQEEVFGDDRSTHGSSDAHDMRGGSIINLRRCDYEVHW